MPSPPPLRLLLLSDSVDRYLTSHLCEWLGGQQQAQVASELLQDAAAGGATVPSADGAAGTPADRRGLAGQQRQWRPRRHLLASEGQAAVPAAAAVADQQQRQQQSDGALTVAPAQPSAGPTNVYTTAYSLHKCVSPTPLMIASSYFPGVHPTGPWHRNVVQSYKERINSAAALWRDYAGDDPPHLVVSRAGGWSMF